LAEKFKQDILSGKIDPDKLSQMTSKERHEFFKSELGEGNASQVNALFESKLLLKNQQAGYISWASRLTGLSKEAKRDIISKIERMDKILSPSEEATFLEDLASQRLGANVTYAEAQKIADMSKGIVDKRTAMEADPNISDEARMEYGRSMVDLNDYVNELKSDVNKFKLSDFKNPAKASLKGASNLAGQAKAIKASLDNSAIFRQGWKTLFTHPTVWAKNATDSLINLVKTLGGKNVMREVQADIVSRPNYDLMKKAKLAVGITEEAFPTSLPEKIWGFGRLYKASETAYTAFVQKTRADVFDKYIDIAQRTGVELTNDQLQSIGGMVNSLTGRANLGRLEPVGDVINNVFFSPRMMKSQFDTLGGHIVTGSGGSNFVRKQAAINMLKTISGTAAILATAKALSPDSVDFDPRSANFGKIRIGDTRFDVTGGAGSIAVLAARLASQSSKSSTSGKVTPLNEKNKDGSPKFGATTGTDVVYNFFENKLSPAASLIKDIMKNQDFEGNKPTVLGELKNLFAPLPTTNAWEAYKNPKAAPLLLTILADFVGIGANTYSAKEKVKAWFGKADKQEPIYFDPQYPLATKPFQTQNRDAQVQPKHRPSINEPELIDPKQPLETNYNPKTKKTTRTYPTFLN